MLDECPADIPASAIGRHVHVLELMSDKRESFSLIIMSSSSKAGNTYDGAKPGSPACASAHRPECRRITDARAPAAVVMIRPGNPAGRIRANGVELPLDEAHHLAGDLVRTTTCCSIPAPIYSTRRSSGASDSVGCSASTIVRLRDHFIGVQLNFRTARHAIQVSDQPVNTVSVLPSRSAYTAGTSKYVCR